jgi:cytochrome c
MNWRVTQSTRSQGQSHGGHHLGLIAGKAFDVRTRRNCNMKQLKVLLLALALFLIGPSIATAQDSATAQEVLQKTREAADYLVREGAKGVATFKSKNPQSFWKSDGYIFIIDCELGRMLANANLALAGAPLKRLHDSLGLYLAKPLCENGRRPHGGWFEIHQPKPNTTKVVRKILYVRPVPGTTYQVGSGIYDDTATVEELNKLSDSQ